MLDMALCAMLSLKKQIKTEPNPEKTPLLLHFWQTYLSYFGLNLFPSQKEISTLVHNLWSWHPAETYVHTEISFASV